MNNKYRYKGNEELLVSSCKEIIRINTGDIVEFDENDIKYLLLDKFELLKEKTKKTTKESEE